MMKKIICHDRFIIKHKTLFIIFAICIFIIIR